MKIDKKTKTTVFVLFVILVFTNLISLFFVFSNKPDVESFKKEYPFIDISRHLIEQKHFINTLEPIRKYMNELVSKEGKDSVSIYFEYLNTGANISINQDLRMLPASLIKVPIALGVMKKIEKGDWKLYNELVITKDDRDSSWGDLHRNAIGTRFTIDKLLEEMLVNSDNTASRILYRNLSTDDLLNVTSATGLESLFNEEGKITAKEYSRIFRILYVSSYLKRENSQKILELLSKTKYDQYLGQSLPDSIPFSHKIGENDDAKVVLDSGIVYLENRPYLITVMIDYSKKDKEWALDLMKKISEKSFEYISKYENN